MSRKRFLRAAVVAGTFGVTGLLGTGIASAHVTANIYGDQPQQGGSGAIVLRVPNEESDAATVKLEVNFKPEYGISSVRYRPVPGWTAEVIKTKLPAPVKNGQNLDVTEPVTKVVWTAQPGSEIAKGADQFQEFELSAYPLPSNVDRLVLPAIQTYDNGKAVAWDTETPPGGPEPEHPAPVVELAPAGAAGEHATMTGTTNSAAATDEGDSTDNTARLLGGAGLVVGALGLGFGVGATMRARRSAK